MVAENQPEAEAKPTDLAALGACPGIPILAIHLDDQSVQDESMREKW
jgi:hypothetical protein